MADGAMTERADAGAESTAPRVAPGRGGHRRRHGHSYEVEYRVWQTMRLRCSVPSNPAFAAYGARGITVCARWRASVHDFIADMGRKPTPRHEIDRIDNDRGYWCGRADCAECGPAGRVPNCRWATRAENCRNRRSTVWLEMGGERRPLVEWSRRTGIEPGTIASRLEHGWSVDRALTTPARRKAPNGAGRARRIA